MSDQDQADLERLLSLYMDGDLDDADVRLLSEMLGDASAREAYLELATANSDLLLLFGAQGASRTDDAPSPTTFAAEYAAPASGRPARGMPVWIRYGIVGIAASLLTVLATVWGVGSDSEAQVASDATPASSSDSESVARIVRKIDCDWEGDRWAVVSSSELFAGQTLTLARGLMEIEFDSGAQVTLEAPVAFRVESAMRAVLSHGKLTANVPESAHGFTVSTPRGETIDLGTEFGLAVAEDGSTETHVFGGEVIVRPHGESVTASEVRLTDAMAIRVADNERVPDRLTAVPQRFTKINFDQAATDLHPPLDRKLAIWLAADHRVQSDEKGFVSAWGDLLSDSNQTEQNAWQVSPGQRPQLVNEAFDGKPALRFSGRQYLVTEPVALGTEQTLAVVFRIDLTGFNKLGVNRLAGRQLVNLNGPPHLVLSVNDSRRLVSRTYAGSIETPKGRQEHVIAGKTTSREKISGEPLVAVSVYDPTSNSSRLYLNGVAVDSSGARPLKPTNSPRYIGSHMFLAKSQFVGDLAELMIFDVGVSDEEAVLLSLSLMDKYGIEKTEAD